MSSKPETPHDIGCPDEDTLLLLVEQSVSTKHLERHIESCVTCQDRLEELTSSDVSVGLPENEMPNYLVGMAGELARQADDIDTTRDSGHSSIDLPGFEILECLGRGGMGVVYRARHEQLDREVAVKVIAAGAHASDEYRQRLQREGQLVARLDDPHIVRIFDSGEHERIPYLVLEFMDSGSLAQRKRELRDPVGCARLIEILARALHTAHQAGIVHRDLKPGNVLLSSTESAESQTITLGSESLIPKIADFGLSKEVLAQATITQSTGVLGTPGYMAPEQANEERNAIGPATDIHALGVMLYELLSGSRPYDSQTLLATIENVRSAEPADLGLRCDGVPEPIARICHQCLQKRPDERYGSALMLANELRRFQEGKPLQETPVERPANHRLARGSAIAIAAGLIGVLLSLIYVTTNQGTVIIDADDSVQIVLRRNDRNVRRITVNDTGQSVSVATGNIEVLVPADSGEEYVVTNSAFRMVRGGRQTVTIRKVEEQLPELGDDTLSSVSGPRPGASQREIAEWILQNGGGVRIVPEKPPIRSMDELPDGEVKIYKVDDTVGFTEGHLAMIAGLPDLRDVSIWADGFEGKDLAELNNIEEMNALGLYYTGVNDENFRAFDNFETLSFLRLAGSPISSSFLDRLEGCDRLEVLGLTENQVLHPDAARILGGLKSLNTIELYEFSEASTALLPKLDQLTRIFFHDARYIGNQSIDHLCRCRNVERIKFWRTDLSKVDLQRLKVLPNLVWLELMNVNVSREQVAKLAELMPNCDIMHSPEKDVRSLVWSVGGTLETEVRERRKTKHYTQYHELQINSINLQDVPKLRDDHFVPYQHLTHLNGLVVEGAPITGATLKHLSHLTMLETLSLRQTEVDDGIIPVLKSFHRLKELDLRDTRMSSKSIPAIAGMKELRRLRLDGNQITADSATVLSTLSKLRSLEISVASNLTMERLSALKQIDELHLHRSYGITDNSIPWLSKMNQLQRLTLAKTNISPEGFRKLSRSLPKCEITTH
ncbi:MAG: protein kinase [Planctomycetota bacterium]